MYEIANRLYLALAVYINSCTYNIYDHKSVTQTCNNTTVAVVQAKDHQYIYFITNIIYKEVNE